MLLKILDLPIFQTLFGDFFENNPKWEEALTKDYELDEKQKGKVNSVAAAYDPTNLVQEVSNMDMDKFKNSLSSAKEPIEFSDISGDFLIYLGDNQNTKKKKEDYKDMDDVMNDLKPMIETSNPKSDLRKKYETALKNLKDDVPTEQNGTYNLVQIMAADIVNFQENGKKYHHERNTPETTTTPETNETNSE